MKILVTGGCGRIGRTVTRILAQHHDVTVLDRVKPDGFPHPVVQADLLERKGLTEALTGFDVVCHLAAIPDPTKLSQQTIIRDNSLSMFNILEAAAEAKIKRVIYGSSDSATGFGCKPKGFVPAFHYLPIDEKHPVLPAEAYSFTKYYGEVMGAGFARAYGFEFIALRYAWVITDDCYEAMKKRSELPLKIPDGVSRVYISPEDVAQGVKLAAELPGTVPFDVFFIMADDVYGTIPTLELVDKCIGKRPEIRKPELYKKNPFATLYDTSKAKEKLGFRPTSNWRELVKLAKA